MAEPFLSEIRICSFNFAPKGWAMCSGQFLPINQNQALFSLLGTTFGGNGQTTFALPDLRGRTPIHVGSGHVLGDREGMTTHTLTLNEIPTHQHFLQGSTNTGTTPVPTSNVLGTVPGRIYRGPSNLAALNASTITTVGGSQPHENMQPFLTLTFCIALQGIFPSPN